MTKRGMLFGLLLIGAYRVQASDQSPCKSDSSTLQYVEHVSFSPISMPPPPPLLPPEFEFFLVAQGKGGEDMIHAGQDRRARGAQIQYVLVQHTMYGTTEHA